MMAIDVMEDEFWHNENLSLIRYEQVPVSPRSLKLTKITVMAAHQDNRLKSHLDQSFKVPVVFLSHWSG